MTDKMNHRGHREVDTAGVRVRFESLFALGGKSGFLLLAVFLLLTSVAAQNRESQPTGSERLRYDIKLAINFDERTYTGTEVVHWVNKGDHATSTIFFHLYPNIRPPDYVAPTQRNDAGQVVADEPRLDITEVRAVVKTTPVSYSLADSQTTLRLNLREPLQPG